MSLENDINILQKVQLFSDFNAEHLRLIAFGSQKLSYASGYEIFREDQATDGGYVILTGSVDLFSFKQEEKKLLANFKSGSLLGEMALISVNRRVATAIVRDDCELIRISRVTMHRVLNEYPELAVALQSRISQSILKFTKEIGKVKV